MSRWLGTWDVEQASIVGTFHMQMRVTAAGDGYDVAFESPQVVATVSDVVLSGDSLSMVTHLTKPLRGKADVDLALSGDDAFAGTGKIKFLPSSKFTGVRAAG